MPLSVSCPSCRRPLTFPDSAAGKVAQCPCGQQMTLPSAPARPLPSASPRPAHHVAPRSVPRPGGSGAAPIVLGVLLLLGGVAALVIFNRQSTEARFAALKAEEAAARAAAEAEKAKAAQWVMVRWWVDDAVLPPDLRSGAEASRHVGIRVEVANKGYDRLRVDAASFRLLADGAPWGTVVPGALEALPVGDVKSGEKIAGGLIFQVPDLSKSFTLECRPVEPAGCEVRYGQAR